MLVDRAYTPVYITTFTNAPAMTSYGNSYAYGTTHMTSPSNSGRLFTTTVAYTQDGTAVPFDGNTMFVNPFMYPGRTASATQVYQYIQNCFSSRQLPRQNALKELLLAVETRADLELAFRAIEMYHRNFVSLKSEATTLLVKACCLVDAGEIALQSLKAQKQLGLSSSLASFHWLMTRFAVEGKIEALNDCYQAFLKSGHQPSSHTLHIMIRAAVDAGDIEGALKLADSSEVELKHGTINLILAGLSRQSDGAAMLERLQSFSASGGKGNVTTDYLEVEALYHCKKYSEAVEKWEKLVSAGADVEPSVLALVDCLVQCDKDGQTESREEGVKILRKMYSNGLLSQMAASKATDCLGVEF